MWHTDSRWYKLCQSVSQLRINQWYWFKKPLNLKEKFAGVAQSVEQLIRNHSAPKTKNNQ